MLARSSRQERLGESRWGEQVTGTGMDLSTVNVVSVIAGALRRSTGSFPRLDDVGGVDPGPLPEFKSWRKLLQKHQVLDKPSIILTVR